MKYITDLETVYLIEKYKQYINTGVRRLLEKKPEIYPCGDNGLMVQFSEKISKKINQQVRFYTNYLQECKLDGILEIIPAYSTILIIYNPLYISYHELLERLDQINNNIDQIKEPSKELITIPVLYGSEYGSDLKFVAEYNNLTEDEVIQIHTSNDYLVYMLGFTPGFPYLGGLDERLATPRLETPRTRIPGGSVGIADKQTGIYPLSSPGGWRLIGRTPLSLFDPQREPAAFLKAGQYLRFQAITLAEYEKIIRQIKEGTYEINKSTIGEERL